jgi:hypothetical protein
VRNIAVKDLYEPNFLPVEGCPGESWVGLNALIYLAANNYSNHFELARIKSGLTAPMPEIRGLPPEVNYQ